MGIRSCTADLDRRAGLASGDQRESSRQPSEGGIDPLQTAFCLTLYFPAILEPARGTLVIRETALGLPKSLGVHHAPMVSPLDGELGVQHFVKDQVLDDVAR